MKTPLDQVSCARIPARALPALAGLRRAEGVRVVLEGESAWLLWPEGEERILRAVLPIGGVELFERRGDAWHRPGHRLPSFEVLPAGDPIPLARTIVPGPTSAEAPPGEPPRPVRLRLARVDRPRATTAALCPLGELGRWADSATSAELAAIRGAISGGSALLLGPSLPAWAGAERFWGRGVLVPIGFEARPTLPEAALREALGGSDGEILRLVPGEGGPAVEWIPVGAFRPLTRAGVRLALSGEGEP